MVVPKLKKNMTLMELALKCNLNTPSLVTWHVWKIVKIHIFQWFLLLASNYRASSDVQTAIATCGIGI